MTALLRYLLRKFYFFLAIALIALAVLVQAGRSFSPFVSEYRTEVSDYLGRELNAKVELVGLDVEWEGLKPILKLDDLHIFSHGGTSIIRVAKARLRFDLLRSLWNGQLVWGSANLQGTSLAFEQAANGFWHVPGLPVNNTAEATQLNWLVNALLLANKIEFQQTSLAFRFLGGHQMNLRSPALLLENHRDFHRLMLKVDVDDRQDAVTLILEGHGDPRDQAQFRAQGYLALKDFPTSEPLAAVTALLLREVTPNPLRAEGALNARVWFNTRSGGEGYDIKGNLRLQTLVVPLFAQQYRLDSFQTQVQGYWSRSGAWQLVLPGLTAALQEAKVEGVNLAVSAAEAKAPLQIQIDKLDLAGWVTILDQAGVLGPGVVRDVVQGLSPRGEITNLVLTLPLADPAAWHFAGRARQVTVNARGGIPALQGVDGYVQANARGGQMNIDSRHGFSMHFHPTFNQAMEYRQVTGQIAWHLRPEQNQVFINSGPIRFRGEAEEATGYLWLSLPWQPNTRDTDLFLHLGARQLPANLYRKYLPARVPESLQNWLAASLGSDNPGSVSEGAFLFRGTLNTPDARARSFQLYLDIDNAALAYHPDWPALEGLGGRLLVSDNQIDAQVFQGRIYDSEISSTRVAVDPHPAGTGGLLKVQGRVQGPAEDGLRILREGTLRSLLGANMDDWLITGQITTQLNLAVPLIAGASGGRQQVDVALDGASLELANLGISLQELAGKISYSQGRGISSENLRAQWLGQPLTANLQTVVDGEAEPRTRIQLEGAMAVKSLATWSQRPELLFLQGSLPYQARIDIHHQRDVGDPRPLVDIAIQSDLVGTKLALPAPLGKPANSSRALAVAAAVRAQTLDVSVNYQDQERTLLQSQFRMQRSDNALLRANLALGEAARLPVENQFLLSGYLPHLDLPAWRRTAEQYQQFRAQMAQARDLWSQETLLTEGIAGLPLQVQLTLGVYDLGPLQLQDLSIRAWQQDRRWHLDFVNPVISGSLQLPLDRSQPMTIAVQELHLNRSLFSVADEDPSGPAKENLAVQQDLPAPGVQKSPTPQDHSVVQENTTEVGVSLTERAAQFHPRDLPSAEVSIAALFFEGRNYGNWSWKIRPDHRGVLFDEIRGNIHGLRIAGYEPSSEAGSVKSGARMYWVLDEQGPRTRFAGSLQADNLADVLQAWQKPDFIDSRSANFLLDLSWPGAPAQFSLAQLQGDIDLQLEDGRFKRNAGAGEGLLRLFAVLNFDSLARRLRLDFSDLYKGGLAYDQVRGKMSFVDGKVYFTEPLLVQSPSSRLQLAGHIDLLDETIDARLIAALPVAGNLTFLAVFATGLPAAAGIYLISKIFRKQVDQATSITYSIKGSWDQPTMKFERLFESESSLRTRVSGRKEKETEPRAVVQ